MSPRPVHGSLGRRKKENLHLRVGLEKVVVELDEGLVPSVVLDVGVVHVIPLRWKVGSAYELRL